MPEISHIHTKVLNCVSPSCRHAAVKNVSINPLNAELIPICHLLALGAHHILHVGRISVNAVAVDKG